MARFIVSSLTVMICAICRFPGSAVAADSPAEPKPDRHGYAWFAVVTRCRQYDIRLKVNAAEYPFDNASTLLIKPLPATDGPVTFTIDFTPKPSAKPNAAFRESNIELVLRKGMTDMAGNVRLVQAGVEEGAARIEITLTMKNSEPVLLVRDEQYWTTDTTHKQLTSRFHVRSDPFSDDYDQADGKGWWKDGKLEYEAAWLGPRLVTAADYKPDGSVGAEIKAGQGWRRSYDDDGSLLIETPYRNGRIDGTERHFDGGKLSASIAYAAGKTQGDVREFDPQGRVRMRGQYHDDVKDGEWVKLDETGKVVERTVFKGGQIIEGRYTFSDWQ